MRDGGRGRAGQELVPLCPPSVGSNVGLHNSWLCEAQKGEKMEEVILEDSSQPFLKMRACSMGVVV